MPQITFYIKEEDKELRLEFPEATEKNGRTNYSEVLVDLMKLYQKDGESLFKTKNRLK